MEIRFLHEDEILRATILSKDVFDELVREYMQNKKMEECFDGYVSEEKIKDAMRMGQLFVWGAYDGENLMGVSAMQQDGHITMLYVDRIYQGRKVAKALLDTMKEYAGRVLKIETVSINAMPAWSSSYFKRNGFWILGNIDVQHASFVPMMANSSCYVKEKETDDSVLVGIICLIAFFIYCILAFLCLK